MSLHIWYMAAVAFCCLSITACSKTFLELDVNVMPRYLYSVTLSIVSFPKLKIRFSALWLSLNISTLVLGRLTIRCHAAQNLYFNLYYNLYYNFRYF